jgi:hypothetical protein
VFLLILTPLSPDVIVDVLQMEADASFAMRWAGVLAGAKKSALLMCSEQAIPISIPKKILYNLDVTSVSQY